MSFAWAITGKKLFEGLAFFSKLKGGKNVSKFASALLLLPGPLKVIGLLALAAGAAYALFGDRAQGLAAITSKDPEGFKLWKERIFGVKDAADKATASLSNLSKANISSRLNKDERAFEDSKGKSIEIIKDAIETTAFDASGNDFSDGGKKAFGPMLQKLTEKISNGTLNNDDLKLFRNLIDTFVTTKGGKLSGLNQRISSEENAARNGEDFSRERKRNLVKMLRERGVLQAEFDRDNEVLDAVTTQLASATKILDSIAKSRARLVELKETKIEPGKSDTVIPGASSTKIPQVSASQRDNSVLDNREAKIRKQLEEGGDAAGKKLAQSATNDMLAKAGEIGKEIGRNQVAEFKKKLGKLTVHINTGTGARELARAKSGALHDGVD